MSARLVGVCVCVCVCLRLSNLSTQTRVSQFGSLSHLHAFFLLRGSKLTQTSAVWYVWCAFGSGALPTCLRLLASRRKRCAAVIMMMDHLLITWLICRVCCFAAAAAALISNPHCLICCCCCLFFWYLLLLLVRLRLLFVAWEKWDKSRWMIFKKQKRKSRKGSNTIIQQLTLIRVGSK